MSAEVEQKKKHLAALETFLQSPAHVGYVAAIKREIQETKDAIVAIVPDNQKDFVELCQQKGALRLLESELTRFEDARVSLGSRIDAMVEAELENATETKK
jgi:crotonobetainyl-CoA:carnitine CoA-transferase CaiB-like acyl-CoA transferase